MYIRWLEGISLVSFSYTICLSWNGAQVMRDCVQSSLKLPSRDFMVSRGVYSCSCTFLFSLNGGEENSTFDYGIWRPC